MRIRTLARNECRLPIGQQTHSHWQVHSFVFAHRSVFHLVFWGIIQPRWPLFSCFGRECYTQQFSLLRNTSQRLSPTTLPHMQLVCKTGLFLQIDKFSLIRASHNREIPFGTTFASITDLSGQNYDIYRKVY